MTDFWKAKLAGWTHDPAEKAFVLMRGGARVGADPATHRGAGHEQGTVKDLRETLGIADADFDRSADWIAAGADRPQWPQPKDAKHSPPWANVRWIDEPVLIHPLTGEALGLVPLRDVEVPEVEAVSFDHFNLLIERAPEGGIDDRLTHLAFWRFGPEGKLAAPDLGALWLKMPADSRVPDHTIWAHLDLVSAVAGARLGGPPALLTMSFGPVQGFIAQARSTSDLWAGSHLLSSLVWAGLQVLCEELGPDAVIQPNLRGVAAVDRWILQSVPAARRDLWRKRFEAIDAEWLRKRSDENSLFAATIPNKFTAIVPAVAAEDLARRIERRVREQALQWANEAAEALFGEAENANPFRRDQISRQMADFPEVSWAAVEWPVPENRRENRLPPPGQIESLKAALGVFVASAPGKAPGVFGEPVWQVLNREVDLQGARFFQPNSGILYSAVHDLAERSLAAAKSCRPFPQLEQKGFRCTLCGEREWLTDDERKLSAPPGKRKETLWTNKTGSNGIKEGEHLCALCTLKRMWPDLFCEQVKDFLEKDDIRRFVVSTHAMAIAPSLDRALGEIERGTASGKESLQALGQLANLIEKSDSAAIPRFLAKRVLTLKEDKDKRTIRCIPGLLDRLREAESPDDDREGGEAERLVAKLLGDRPETYYALLKMDGDNMGKWIAGGDESVSMTYKQSWHSQIRDAMSPYMLQNAALKGYIESPRADSPSRHSAISAALNDFSGSIVRHVIEECFKGRLIYAGGDDGLAMLSVDDLLPAMLLLRAAYSGLPPAIEIPTQGLSLNNGYAMLRGRVFTTMGSKATASMGAVVAHHKAPLAAVLRDLDAAEKQAKAHKPVDADRNAFCIRVQKRAGGEIGVTGRFRTAEGEKGKVLGSASAEALIALRSLLQQSDVSRRAVYHSVEWLRALPAPGSRFPAWREMVAANLAYQIARQSGKGDAPRSEAQRISEILVDAALADCVPAKKDGGGHGRTAKTVLEDLLVTAEFFARESRSAIVEEVTA